MLPRFAHAPVGELVVEQPSRARVFQRLGIDYWCQGRKPLLEACRERRLDAERICSALQELEEQESREAGDGAADRDAERELARWSNQPLSALVDHIVKNHHTLLKVELDYLRRLSAEVTAGAASRCFAELDQMLGVLARELRRHMWQEEFFVFPWLKSLENLPAHSRARCLTLDPPLETLEDEHRWAMEVMARMRWLADCLEVDSRPRITRRQHKFLGKLAVLESDLRDHFHQENNVLFPRAARMCAPHDFC